MRRRPTSTTFFFLALTAGLLIGAVWGVASEERPDSATQTVAPDAKPTQEQDEAGDEKAADKTSGSGQQSVDEFFGKYLVKPLETVLFFDFGTGKWLNPQPKLSAQCPKCKEKFDTAKQWPELPESGPVECPTENCEGKIDVVQYTSVPLVVLWLLIGAIFFTARMGFINFRGFSHGIQLIRGRYDNPEETGEVSHFQALASALSATIGLGNIAGVAIAVGSGGPGAIFWMIVAGLLGMTSKFAECTLSQMYRKVDRDGTVSGGPMRYLYQGLREIKIGGVGLGALGAVLAVIFAVFCMGGSFGGGCAFQVSQSKGTIQEQMTQHWPDFRTFRQLEDVRRDPAEARNTATGRIKGVFERKQLAWDDASETIDADDVRNRLDEQSLSDVDRRELDRSLALLDLSEKNAEELAEVESQLGWSARFFGGYLGWVYGLIMAVLVGLVIIGGIRRIAATAEKIVPLMCTVYVLTALYVLVANADMIAWAFGVIVSEAFQWQSAYGGFLGVLVLGIRRAAFSNEAGIGSAAIAHAAAKTEEPVREGIVASLGPFIDTVVICTMTGLVIVITKAYSNPEYAQLVASKDGAALTSRAFAGVVEWFPWILCVAVVLFAYSTMISWSYYGERCWSHLFGPRLSLAYKMLFLSFVVLGAVVTADNVLNFSDFMILSMAFPNILGVALLSGKIRLKLDDYWRRYKAGEMEPK